MDRTIIFPLEQLRDYDFVKAFHDIIISEAGLAADILGQTSTVLSGLAAAQTATPSLSILLGSGRIYQMAAVDAVAVGSIAQDTYQILQQGFATAQTIVLSTAGITTGQSRWSLIEAQFSQVDAVRSDDPNGGIVPFYNSANPAVPSNTGINTVRQGLCVIQVITGAAAATGSEVPPSPTSGWVPLYLVDLSYGQTAVTTSQILVAGPSVGAGVPSNYTQAPFLAGLTNSHHAGISGQAPKIKLGSEVQGSLPLANLPASGLLGGLSAVQTYTGNPNSHVAGNAAAGGLPPDLCWDSTDGALYICTTTGTTSTAVWIQIGGSGFLTPVSTKSAAYTVTASDNGALIVAGAYAMTLPSAPATAFRVTILSSATGTTILPNGNTVNLASGATSSTISLPVAGDFVTLVWDGSVWRVVGGSAAMLNAGASATGYNRGVKIQVTSSTAISVAASTLAASNAAGAVLPISALSATIATGTTGLGGLDTGTIAASTVYYVYAVSNGTTAGAVISTSSANPASAITTTYPYYLRIGSVRTNASSLLLGTLQVGKTVRYVIGGPNVSSMPQMASAGTSGGALTAISAASYVPPNASKIGLLLAFSGTGSSGAVYAAAAPNGNYSTPSGYNSTPMWLGCTSLASAGAVSSDMLLESGNVYYASNYSTTGLFCLGWEESI